MYDPLICSSEIKGFHEYSQSEIGKMLASNSLMSVVIRVLSEYKVRGYIVGDYVRNMILGNHTSNAKIVVFGDAIAIAKAIKKICNSKCNLSIFKNSDSAELDYFNGNSVKTKISIVNEAIYPEHGDTRNRKPLFIPTSIEEYLLKSDFTIDALAIGLTKDNLGYLYNPDNALNDIYDGSITTIINPRDAFAENHYLAWKCFIYAAKTNFQILDECIREIKSLDCPNFCKSNNISVEFQSILSSANAAGLFDDMQSSGVLNTVLPELSALDKTETRNGFSYRNDFKYSIHALNVVCQHSGSLRLRLVAILMNIGKSKVKKFDNSRGWTFYGIDTTSAKMVPGVFRRLKLPCEDLKYVQSMILLLKKVQRYDMDTISSHSIKKIINESGDNLDDLLLLYTSCSYLERSKKNVVSSTSKFLKKIDYYCQKKDRFDTANKVCIDGYAIMKLFNQCSGANIGRLKKYLADEIINGNAENTYESLYPLLINKAKELGLEVAVNTDNSQDNISVISSDKELSSEDKYIDLITEASDVEYVEVPTNQQRLLCGDHCLTFNDDGTYIYETLEDVRNEFEPNEELSLDSVDNTSDFILQCYSNGNVNKVSLDSISKLRDDFEYRNGVFKMQQQQRVLAVSDNDILIAYIKSKMKYSIKLVQVSLIPVHSIFGLKGYPLLASSEDENQILSWCVVKNSEKNNISSILCKERFPCILQMESELHKQAIEWIKLKL